MSIIKCRGPKGEEGYRADTTDPTTGATTVGECHLLDPNLPVQQARATALRAAMRDANAVVSGGDPRMARDG